MNIRMSSNKTNDGVARDCIIANPREEKQQRAMTSLHLDETRQP